MYPDTRLRIGTWNVQSLRKPGAFDGLITCMKEYRLELVALQETRWPKSGDHASQGYTLLYSGDDLGNLGVGFLLGPQVKKAVLDFKAVDNRMCRLRLRMRLANLSIVCIHAPTEVSQPKDKDSFYDNLDDLMGSIPEHDVRIVIGDFNARAGRNQTDLCDNIGPFSRHEQATDNGERMMYFAIAHDLKVSSTFFQHKNIHLETWTHPRKTSRSQIDHVLISKNRARVVQDVRSYRSATNHVASDHRLVITKLRWQFSYKSGITGKRTNRFNCEGLKNQDTRDLYQNKVSNGIIEASYRSDDVNSIWEVLKTSVISAAQQTLGMVITTPKNDWFDEECRLAVEQQNIAYCEAQTRFTIARNNKAVLARRTAKRICRRKKREWWKAQVTKVQQLSNERNSRNFFKEVAGLHNTFRPRSTAIRDQDGNLRVNIEAVLDTWKEHFTDLLNVQHVSHNANEASQMQTAEMFIEDPSYEEFTQAVQRLKRNRSPGVDCINSELLIFGGETLWNYLFDLIRLVWQNEVMPDEWKVAAICPIFKKGDRSKCENYRGIALLCTAYKLLSYIVLGRITPLAEEIIGDYQGGFRPNRSVTDQVFSLRMILSKYYETPRDVHQVFLDFRQAYDSINRESLWFALEFLGIPKKYVHLCQLTVTQSQCCVKVENNLSGVFAVNSGVRQGDALSPILFNLMLEYIFRKSNTPQGNILYQQSNQVLAYADDICVIGLASNRVKEVLDPLVQFSASVGLEINEGKTKYLVTGFRDQDASGFSSGDHTFERVMSFRYLGSLITHDNSVGEDIKARLAAGNRALYPLRSLLKSKYLANADKLKLYKVLIRPVVMYGCDSWTLTDEHERWLRTFERRIMRMIYGPKRDDDGTYRVLYNHEIRNLMKIPDIVVEIKAQRIRWLGHVLRADPERMVQRSLRGEPPFGRRRGRCRRRWLLGVENDLALLDSLGQYEELARDRTRWSQIIDSARASNGL